MVSNDNTSGRPRAEFWNDGAVVAFDCPGCKLTHALAVKPLGNMPVWGFNNDLAKPTLTPSILCRYGLNPATDTNHVCHSFVTDGRIQFLSDCTHALAGQTVDLAEIPDVQ